MRFMLVRMILLRHELKARSSMHNRRQEIRGSEAVLCSRWKRRSGEKTGVAEDHRIMGPSSSQHQLDRSRLGTVTLPVSLSSTPQ